MPKISPYTLHTESQIDTPRSTDPTTSQETLSANPNALHDWKCNVLLMTCRVLITAPDGSSVEVRALLNNASSASFIFEHLANRLSLKRRRQSIHVSGIGGMSHKSPLQSIITFEISSLQPSGKRMKVTAFIVLKVASDLSMEPVLFGLGYLFR